jgi:hypothetical protein
MHARTLRRTVTLFIYRILNYLLLAPTSFFYSPPLPYLLSLLPLTFLPHLFLHLPFFLLLSSFLSYPSFYLHILALFSSFPPSPFLPSSSLTPRQPYPHLPLIGQIRVRSSQPLPWGTTHVRTS